MKIKKYFLFISLVCSGASGAVDEMGWRSTSGFLQQVLLTMENQATIQALQQCALEDLDVVKKFENMNYEGSRSCREWINDVYEPGLKAMEARKTESANLIEEIKKNYRPSEVPMVHLQKLLQNCTGIVFELKELWKVLESGQPCRLHARSSRASSSVNSRPSRTATSRRRILGCVNNLMECKSTAVQNRLTGWHIERDSYQCPQTHMPYMCYARPR